ncbi:MAG TPA: hypothetical protein VL137_17065 [Polyangiaceae bacterium]|nr:hypothetical protein [Polyangiaceae bacterium]
MALLKHTALYGLASMLTFACGGSNEPAQTPPQQGQQPYPQQQGYQQQPPPGYQQQQPGYQQQPPPGYQQQPQPGYAQQQPQQPQYQQPAPGQPAPAQPAQPAPAQPGMALPPNFSLPGMAPPPAGQAQPVDASVAAAAQGLIAQLAASQAPAGAKPLGSLIAGNFSTGSSLESQVQLQPGKCYTVVGAGLPNVTELNLQFVGVTPIPGMNPVLAQDQSTGAQAVLGPKPNCYKQALMVPVPAKLVITVSGGSGIAGAQIFEK